MVNVFHCHQIWSSFACLDLIPLVNVSIEHIFGGSRQRNYCDILSRSALCRAIKNKCSQWCNKTLYNILLLPSIVNEQLIYISCTSCILDNPNPIKWFNAFHRRMGFRSCCSMMHFMYH